jgi:hypothetical protein
MDVHGSLLKTDETGPGDEKLRRPFLKGLLLIMNRELCTSIIEYVEKYFSYIPTKQTCPATPFV